MGSVSSTICIILTALFVFLSGCVQISSDNSSASSDQSLIDSCIQACETSKAAGNNLENGPCLLNPMPQDKLWVCDVAHDPRSEMDNLPENQCSAFGKNGTNHFIEVSPECKFIRKL